MPGWGATIHTNDASGRVPDRSLRRWDPTVSASAACLNLLGLALPLATLHIYDRVLPNQGVETLLALALGLGVVAALELALRAAQSSLMIEVAAWGGRDLKLAAVERLLAASETSRSTRTPTETLERIVALDRYAAFFGGAARQAWIDLPFAAAALVLIALIGGTLVAAPLTVLALYLAALFHIGRAAAAEARDQRDESVKAQDFLLELFRSIATVKGLALEDRMARRFDRLTGAAVAARVRAITLATRLQRVTAFFGNAVFVATLAAGAAMAAAGQLTIGALAAATLLAGRAAQPAMRLARAWTEVQRAQSAREAAAGLFAQSDAPGLTDPAAAKPAPRAGEPGGDGWLQPPSLTFRDAPGFLGPAGGLILVRGGEACDRSAFLEDVVGLRAPSRALLDGLPATEARRAQPEAMALAPRAPALMSGTILHLLTLFGEGCSEAEAVRAAERLGLDDEIRRLPAGYDTWLGTGASQPASLSIRKQIPLARALARPHRLLALDEPTDHLDPASVARVRAAVLARRGGATLVVASRDPGFFAAADMVVSIDEAEPGGHALDEDGAAAADVVRSRVRRPRARRP